MYFRASGEERRILEKIRGVLEREDRVMLANSLWELC